MEETVLAEMNRKGSLEWSDVKNQNTTRRAIKRH